MLGLPVAGLLPADDSAVWRRRYGKRIQGSPRGANKPVDGTTVEEVREIQGIIRAQGVRCDVELYDDDCRMRRQRDEMWRRLVAFLREYE